MSKVFYSDETLTSNKAELSEFIKNISDALDEINKVNVSLDFVCPSGKSVSEELELLKDKIVSIKQSLTSYENHLIKTDKTYKEISDDVNDALGAYKKQEG